MTEKEHEDIKKRIVVSPIIKVHGTASIPRHISLLDMMDNEKTETVCDTSSVSGRPNI